MPWLNGKQVVFHIVVQAGHVFAGYLLLVLTAEAGRPENRREDGSDAPGGPSDGGEGNPRANTFLLIALHTGMRRGEILGLMWEDIDFAAEVIHVRHNAILGKGETAIQDTLKTDAGHRGLPETHVTAHVLRHTYVTRLFEAGVDIKEIQYLAGHSTVDMTLGVYTHYDRRSREGKTAEKVREAMRENM